MTKKIKIDTGIEKAYKFIDDFFFHTVIMGCDTNLTNSFYLLYTNFTKLASIGPWSILFKKLYITTKTVFIFLMR